MRVLVAGIIGRYPLGGVAWCSLMYLLGLRELGHEVFYVEDTGECVYDPVANAHVLDPAYGTAYIDAALRPHGLGESWSFVNHDGTYHGQPRASVASFARSADLFINLSGGSWFWREEYACIPRKVFIDTDPAFTQISIDKDTGWYREFFRGFDRLFTFGAAIGSPSCDVPTAGFDWQTTSQPVLTSLWRTAAKPARDRYTTVMSWKIHSFADIGGNKDVEFLRVLDLPHRTSAKFELAVSGPREFLASHGWDTVDALDASRSLESYRRFIQDSKAEFSVAKHTYVDTRCGWFSDRTACYLAAGRPAVVQDTGWSAFVPAGEGLFAFSTADEALSAIDAIDGDYDRHAGRAAEIAAEHFESRKVLSSLLERVS